MLRRDGEATASARPRFRRSIIAGMVGATLVAGAWLTNRHGRLADEDERNNLLISATAMARTLNGDEVRPLHFDARDHDSPPYRRICGQMAAFAEVRGHRIIYSLVLRDDRVLFGPESPAPGGRRASSPGTRYERAPAELRAVFQTRQAAAVGPYTDEYGSFVSAFAPVLDPCTGETLLMIGVDAEAAQWSARVARARLRPILFTILVAGFLLGGAGLLRWRDRSPAREGRLRHLEIALAIVGGAMLTCGTAAELRAWEQRARRHTLVHLAEAVVGRVDEVMHTIRNTQLEGLARLIEITPTLAGAAFYRYADQLNAFGAVQAWAWAPAVRGAAVPDFVAQRRAEGLTNFAVWRLSVEGAPRPAPEQDSYPVLYAAPRAEFARAVGFDLSCEFRRRAALDEAARTGLCTVTVPAAIARRRGRHKAAPSSCGRSSARTARCAVLRSPCYGSRP